MTINFAANAEKLFTPVFYQIRRAKTRYVVVYGGANSSKSYSVHQNELLNIMMDDEGDTLIARKFGADLRNSCYKLMCQLISDYALTEEFKCNYSNDNRRITFLPNGRSIIFTGIDDSDRLKSIVGIKRIIMEEANQFDFEDFVELTRRARGYYDIQIILILNPISENHWIKHQLCEPASPYATNTTVLRFTYHDNTDGNGESCIPVSDITELERLKLISENHYRIYVLAEWGVDTTESKFCWAFNSTTQIKPTAAEGDRLLWASFDFNINPLTCTIAQIIPEEQTVRAIECIKLTNSDIWQMCGRLQAAYPNAMWMVTGDSTGQNRSAMVADNLNYYNIIQHQLSLTGQQLAVPTINPRIEENRVLVNAVHKNWHVEIDPTHCKPLIYDLTYVEVNGRGEILKDRSAPNKFADFLDTWRYLLNTAVKEWIF